MPIGPFMIAIKGATLLQAEINILQNNLIGGVLLSTQNYQSLEQLQQLIYSIRNVCRQPLLIAVDQECGSYQQFTQHFTLLPSLFTLGEIYNAEPNTAIEVAAITGFIMASELLAIGIDISFGLVLDLNANLNSSTKDRGFHSQANIVKILGQGFMQGMKKAGMATIAKHFPGLGHCNNINCEIPVDEREPIEILNNDLFPFLKLAREDLSGMMVSPLITSKIDFEPVTFSKFWLQQALRQQIGFKGALISSDLSILNKETCLPYLIPQMQHDAKQAVSMNSEEEGERAWNSNSMANAELCEMSAYITDDYQHMMTKALNAGCDMIIIENLAHDTLAELVQQFKNYQNIFSQQRLLKLAGQFQFTFKELREHSSWQKAFKKLEKLNAYKS